MKKLFALLFFLGAVTAVFAQNNRSRQESRDVILGQQRNDRTIYEDRRNDGYYSERDLNARIERINSEYNWKIESVRNDRHLRKAEKKRQVRMLENERNDKIRQTREWYYNRNDRSYRNDRNRTRY